MNTRKQTPKQQNSTILTRNLQYGAILYFIVLIEEALIAGQ